MFLSKLLYAKNLHTAKLKSRSNCLCRKGLCSKSFHFFFFFFFFYAKCPDIAKTHDNYRSFAWISLLNFSFHLKMNGSVFSRKEKKRKKDKYERLNERLTTETSRLLKPNSFDASSRNRVRDRALM